MNVQLDNTVEVLGPFFDGIFEGFKVAPITVTVLDDMAARWPRTVEIDIAPGSAENTINLDSQGIVKVAILSSSTFDATTVDPSSVTLASSAVKLKGNGDALSQIQDVNNDGSKDLIVQIILGDLALSSTDASATLSGITYDGTIIRGSDFIRIVREDTEINTEVCHQSQILSIVSQNALENFLAQGAHLLSPESCDGIDNDCNQFVDDGSAITSCGDGIACTVDACASAQCSNTPDDSLCDPTSRCDAGVGCVPLQPTTVFITSGRYDGALGGLAGADQKCTDLANAATLPGSTYTAWLSDSNNNAKDRISKIGPYRMVGGALLAVDFEDLTDDHPVDVRLNENGDDQGRRIAWTSTNSAGEFVEPSCEDWTDNNVGTFGGRGSIEGIIPSSASCAGTEPLICFEDRN